MHISNFKTVRYFFAAVVLSAALTACGAKDADIEKAIKANPSLSEVQTSIKDGVVTLSGDVKDEASKAEFEKLVKEIKGVKSVVNNTTIAPPAPAPVEINADSALSNGIKEAIKDFATVKADVKDGIVTLTGEIKKDRLSKLMQIINSLKPKKVVNQLTISK